MKCILEETPVENITKEQSKKDWKDLCDFVKTEILKYDEKKIFPKTMVFRLRGFSYGTDYKNKNYKQQYSYGFILKYFKFAKYMILEAIARTDIKNESHLCNLIMKVAQDNFNDFIDLYRKKIIREKQLEQKDMEGVITNENPEYIKRERKVKDNW